MDTSWADFQAEFLEAVRHITARDVEDLMQHMADKVVASLQAGDFPCALRVSVSGG